MYETAQEPRHEGNGDDSFWLLSFSVNLCKNSIQVLAAGGIHCTCIHISHPVAVAVCPSEAKQVAATTGLWDFAQ